MNVGSIFSVHVSGNVDKCLRGKSEYLGLGPGPVGQWKDSLLYISAQVEKSRVNGQ